MNLQSLNRRIAAISANIEAMRPAAVQPQDDPFCMELLTEQEQETLIAFLESIKDKVSLQPGLRGLSDQQLDTLHLWLELGQSLKQDDTCSAARYRRWLNTPLEQITQAFLSLDISFLPADVNAAGIPVEEDNCIYHLNRTSHRYTAQDVARKGPASRLEDMRRWLTYLEDNPALVAAA